MTIIEISEKDGFHRIELQSHRNEVWMEGYIAVPPELEMEAWDSGGYCDLIIQDGILTGITPTKRPEPEISKQPTTEERLSALESAMLTMMGV